MVERVDVLIIGGGIIGAAVAERLARDGRSVMLVERGSIGASASYAAAGLLTPVHPWNYPAPLLDLDAESLELWPDMAARLRGETGVDVELRTTGMLSLIESELDEREAERRVDWKRSRGETVERLSTADALEAEPLLNPEIRGALLLPDLSQVRAHRAAPALALAAAAHGAEVRENVAVLELSSNGEDVTGARTTAGDVAADAVVLAAGAWSGGLLPAFHRPPASVTRPARGQMLAVRNTPRALRHMILADGDYLVPRADGRVLAGSTLEYVGFDSNVTVGGLASIAAATARMAPRLAGAPLESHWAGLRPDTPDHLPVLGHVCQGLIAATGHFRNGIMLAPVTAEIVRDLLAGDDQRDLSPFSPHRTVAMVE